MRKLLAVSLMMAVQASLAQPQPNHEQMVEQMQSHTKNLEGAPVQLKSQQGNINQLLIDQLQSQKEVIEKNPIYLQKNLHEERAKAQVKDLTNNIKKKNNKEAESKEIVMIFMSFAMGDEEVAQAYEMIAEHPDALIVYRGLPASEKDYKEGKQEIDIATGIKRLQKPAYKLKYPPNMVINPNLFRFYDVQSVPQMVLTTKGENRPAIARVLGSYNPQIIKDRVKRGNYDTFTASQMMAIAEPDLISIMEERAKNLDFASIKDNAKRDMWRNLAMQTQSLEAARDDRIRYVSLAFTNPEDIKDVKGRVITPKGKLIDPLAIRSFTQKLVIFNPNDRRQLDIVEREIRNSTKNVLVMMTEAPEKETEGHKALVERFNRNVFLLPKDLITRFGLEFAPAIIEEAEDGKTLKVTEFGVRL